MEVPARLFDLAKGHLEENQPQLARQLRASRQLDQKAMELASRIQDRKSQLMGEAPSLGEDQAEELAVDAVLGPIAP